MNIENESEIAEVGLIGKIKSIRDRMESSKSMRKMNQAKFKGAQIMENDEVVSKSTFPQAVFASLLLVMCWTTASSIRVSSYHSNMSVMYQETSANDEHHIDLQSEVVGFANEDYALYPRGSNFNCPPVKSIQTVDQCFEAGKSLGLGKTKSISDVLVGDWDHTPQGCFSNLGELHFSRYTGNDIHRDTVYWKNYSSICSVRDSSSYSDNPVAQINTEYKIHEYGSLDECPQHLILSSIEACFEAARTLRVGRLVNLDDILVGSWSHTPRGCFLNVRGGKVLFSDFTGEQLNKGTEFWTDYAAICFNDKFDTNSGSPLRDDTNIKRSE